MKKENKLLKKAIDGNSIALAYFVKKYEHLAYTIAFKIVNNKEDAEEIVQDSFMKAFESLSKFKKSSKFSSWLYRIVYNTAINKTKEKKTILQETVNKIEKGEKFKIDANQWSTLRKKERKKFIDIVLLKLPEEERVILTLYYIGEKSISEICAILNLKKSAVKMRLLRSRKEFKNQIKEVLGTEILELL